MFTADSCFGPPANIIRNDSPPRRQPRDEMCCPRRPSCRDRPTCRCAGEESLFSYDKCIKCARILTVLCFLSSFVWFSADRTYYVLRRELEALSAHIGGVENFLKTASDSKAQVQQQLSDIAGSIPIIKSMAATLSEDINKCKSSGRNMETLRGIIREELENFSADKTGRTDYALESSGGVILNTRNTKSITTSSSLSLFGIPLCQSSNSPRALIQPGVMPGECWAFKGAAGSAVIKLIKPIVVTGVSVEHIPRRISPTGNTSTAPKEFSIWGIRCAEEEDGFFFGKFKYDIEGTSVQYFPVSHRSSRTFDIIEFKVHSNHGHPEYTCVYRLRVHGDIKR